MWTASRAAPGWAFERNRAKKKAEIAARSAAYHAANKATIAARKAKARKANLAAAKLRELKYRKSARGRIVNANCKKRRVAKMKGTPVGNLAVISAWELSWRGKKRVRCYWCGGSFSGSSCHTDHVVALALGGAHEIGNLVVSCLPCNHSKNAKPVASWNSSIAEPVLL